MACVEAQLGALLTEAGRSPLGQGRAWIGDGPLVAYIRVSQRFVNGRRTAMLELANIAVEPSQRRKGHAKRLIDLLLKQDLPLFVENVSHDGLRAYLDSLGFQRVSQGLEILDTPFQTNHFKQKA